ncbi:hypothetical protein JCM10207_004338 [Rhodosporidiobolus poonsookiae]
MASLALTPSAQRNALQPNNTRNHSVRAEDREVDARPDAPVFLDDSLFLNALTANANAATSASRLHALDIKAQANSRKRTAADDADAHQAKKARATTAGQPVDGNAKRKSKRVDRHAEKQKRLEKERLAEESAQWRAKYKKAFPSFTFYFDAIDEQTKAVLSVQVKKLGAFVDTFFSKKVTHVVTTRTIPTVGKENVLSPTAREIRGSMDSASGKTKKQTARSPTMYSLAGGQKLRTGMAGDDKNPFIDSQDILSKALDFGLKIWPCDKLQLILSRINAHSPNKVDPTLQRNPSLPTLLRDEQLYGTRERDPFVPRNDMHYFGANRYYLLVEDSTGEHRPIVAKEYERPRKHEDPQWPILWGGIEGRTGFYHYEGEIEYERKRPPPPPQPQFEPSKPAESVPARALAPNLRRAVSLQNVARGAGQVAGAIGGGPSHNRDYIAASGNSQIITSNIASATSTANRSGAAQASRFGVGSGPFMDKRLAVLSNRTVSVAGAALLGSGSNAGASGSGGVMASGGRGAGGRVAALKRQGKLQRSVSVDAGLAGRRVPADVPAREEPKKPGYCENCRLKYDDFKDHVVSSKHRRFALNPKNWVELDGLLAQIRRPLRPLRRTTVHLNDLVLRGGVAETPSSDGSQGSAVEDSGFFDATVAQEEKDEASSGEEYTGDEAEEPEPEPEAEDSMQDDVDESGQTGEGEGDDADEDMSTSEFDLTMAAVAQMQESTAMAGCAVAVAGALLLQQQRHL